jgi:hypothetical protein
MAEHDFNFDGGNYLTKMGATWFVSYSFNRYVDKSHTNWKKVSTCNMRTRVFDETGNFHKFWLEQILIMNNRRLNTNTINLRGEKTKEMAKVLLQKHYKT